MVRMIIIPMWMRGKIIQIRLNDVSNVMESIWHLSLKIFSNILNAKRKLFIWKSPPWKDKGDLILIGRCIVYLVITRKTIHKGKNLTPSTFINDLVYKRCGVIILWIGIIKVMVINTDTNGALLLCYQYNIWHAIYKRDRMNKSSFKNFFNFPLMVATFLGCTGRSHWWTGFVLG